MIRKIKIKNRDFYIQAYIPNKYANLAPVYVKESDDQLGSIRVDFEELKLKHTGKDTKYAKDFMSDLTSEEVIQSIKNEMNGN